MKYIDYDAETLYREVRERAEAESALDPGAWKDVIDDVLAGHAEFGEIEEQEMQELKETLAGRFADFEDEQRGGPSSEE